MKLNLKFEVMKSGYDFGYQINVWNDQRGAPDGCLFIASPIEFKRLEPGDTIGAPTIQSIRDVEIQGLMDELWRVCIRPSNGEGNVGQIGAMSEHLKDMRKIAFRFLDVPNPYVVPRAAWEDSDGSR